MQHEVFGWCKHKLHSFATSDETPIKDRMEAIRSYLCALITKALTGDAGITESFTLCARLTWSSIKAMVR